VDDDITRRVLAGGSGSEDSNNELGDAHSHGTPQKNRSATPLVDGIKTREGRADVDARGDKRDNERVMESRILEELSTVVEDEVDTSQLLQTLEQTSGQETLSNATLEAVDVR